MDYSYEEIRSVVFDILAGREAVTYDTNQFAHLSTGVGEVLLRRSSTQNPQGYTAPSPLSGTTGEVFLEVFWDLFRQGIITLGINSSNPKFPWFRLSMLGQKVLAGEKPYFFHDTSSYAEAIKKAVPTINDVTLVYLQEAAQAFWSGCILSATVMLGVATEHTFLLLAQMAANNSIHKTAFASVEKERSILHKINKFKNILDQNMKGIPRDILEDLDTNFLGILSVIRNFRNESGHPTGKIIDREQAFILLQLFIPHCRKMYQLMDYFR